MQEYIKPKLQHTALYITILLSPIAYFFITKQFAIIAMFFIALIAIIIDVSIYNYKKIQDILPIISYKLSSKSYIALGFLIATILFSKGIAITSSIVLMASDRCYAIFKQKSFEESVAFFLSAIMISLFVFQIEQFHSNFWIILIAGIITSYLDYNSDKIPINHNIIIPVAFGSIITIMGIICL